MQSGALAREVCPLLRDDVQLVKQLAEGGQGADLNDQGFLLHGVKPCSGLRLLLEGHHLERRSRAGKLAFGQSILEGRRLTVADSDKPWR